MPEFHLLLCCHKSHLKVCHHVLFCDPSKLGKMRRRIRQRVCQLTHSDLGVSHGLGKKARPGGTSRGRGRAYYLPYTSCLTLGKLLPVCASVTLPTTQQWVLHQQQLLAPSAESQKRTISAHTTAMNCLCTVCMVFKAMQKPELCRCETSYCL